MNLKPYEPGRDPNTGYVTRDGRKVRILATNRRSGDLEETPIVALINDPEQETLYAYKRNGEFIFGSGPHDLMCAPVQRTVWVNVYLEGDAVRFSGSYSTYEDAYQSAFSWLVACIPVTFTEGQGLKP